MSDDPQIVDIAGQAADVENKDATMTVRVGDVIAYQERTQTMRANQIASMNRLLKRIEELEALDDTGMLDKIKQLEAINSRDADTIASLDGQLGTAIEDLRALNVRLQQVISERDEFLNTVNDAMAYLAQRIASHTRDGDPVHPTPADETTSHEVDTQWDRHADVSVDHEEAIRQAELATPTFAEIMTEDRPAKHLRA
jgi:hypothetical protein